MTSSQITKIKTWHKKALMAWKRTSFRLTARMAHIYIKEARGVK